MGAGSADGDEQSFRGELLVGAHHRRSGTTQLGCECSRRRQPDTLRQLSGRHGAAEGVFEPGLAAVAVRRHEQEVQQSGLLLSDTSGLGDQSIPSVPYDVMESRVKTWVRVGMVVLAVPQLVIGIWAMLAPHSWYQSFPGVEPHLISADPPYNAHLATDAGIGFFCTGVGLLLAAAWGRRSGVWVALVTFLAFALPHALYHAGHKAPGLSDADDVREVLFLFFGVVFGVVLAWGAWSREEEPIPSSDPESFVHSTRDPAGP